MARRFERALDSATDQTLVDPNWEGILECVDMIRGGDVPLKQALPLIQKRYHHENPHVAHHALLVLEACVKNCGTKFHKEIATKEFMDDLKNLVIQGAQDKVQQKVLELVQCWASAFRDRTEYRIFVDTHNLMKMSGYQFPAMKEADAMFVAESAPDWVEGDNCYRCRVEFGLLTRKHHCRACGQIFCDKCSGKQMFLPQFGIEKKVRVCETCFDKRQKKAAQFTQDKKTEKAASATTNGDDEKVKIQELIEKEDEEWQLALAISQSEAEAKERERQRELYRLYNGTDADDPVAAVQDDYSSVSSYAGIYKGAASNTITETPSRMENDEPPVDDALAKYLDRDYWERRRNNVETDIGGFKATAPPPSEIGSSIGQYIPSTNLSTPTPTPTQNGFMEKEYMSSDVTQGVGQLTQAFGKQFDAWTLIVNDSAIHSLFSRLTERHAEVLGRMNKLETEREYYERLQDHLAHIQEARQAVNALRDEHERQRKERERQAELMRQQQMQHKLEYMRQKKHEMLLYQRHMALQRFQEQEQQMQQRRSMQPAGQPVPYGAQPYYPYGACDQNGQYPPQGYYGPGATGYEQAGVTHSQSMQSFPGAQFPQPAMGEQQPVQQPQPQGPIDQHLYQGQNLQAHGYQVPQGYQPPIQQQHFYAMQPQAAPTSQGIPASASQG
ncbi:VHS domain containing protein, partial [Aphelenchoides avenae]